MWAPSPRQGHPRHRPALPRPELDTLAKALTTWPWVITGPVLYRGACLRVTLVPRARDDPCSTPVSRPQVAAA